MLLVSGGHSQFVLVRGVGDYERWGTTIDDALGEAFDKVAKLLGLGNPGGPQVERQARLGDPTRFRFPRPLLQGRPARFLVLRPEDRGAARRRAAWRRSTDRTSPISAPASSAPWPRSSRRGAQSALAQLRAELPGTSRCWWWPAASPPTWRSATALREAASAAGARLVVPPIALCTDNGAMVAWAGAERLALGVDRWARFLRQGALAARQRRHGADRPCRLSTSP